VQSALITIQHSTNGVDFTKRGTVEFGNSETETHISQVEPPKFSENSKFYTVKITEYGTKVSVPMCDLIASNLHDQLTIFLDHTGNFIHINYHTSKTCTSGTEVSSNNITQLGNWQTTVSIKRLAESERPVEIIETPEEKEKEKPGFFQKYWYFIVTVVIMMVFNAVMGGSNVDPSQAGNAPRRR